MDYGLLHSSLKLHGLWASCTLQVPHRWWSSLWSLVVGQTIDIIMTTAWITNINMISLAEWTTNFPHGLWLLHKNMILAGNTEHKPHVSSGGSMNHKHLYGSQQQTSTWPPVAIESQTSTWLLVAVLIMDIKLGLRWYHIMDIHMSLASIWPSCNIYLEHQHGLLWWHRLDDSAIKS